MRYLIYIEIAAVLVTDRRSFICSGDTFSTKVAVHQFIKDKVRAACGTGFLSREAVGDLHLMPPKNRQSVEWGPGEVINWVHNNRRSHLEIQCQLQRNAVGADASESDDGGPKLRWESCGSIEPGAGERFRVNDGDVFKAVEDGEVVDSWTADISRGVVHDIFVGGVPQNRASGKRERTSSKKKAKKKDKQKRDKQRQDKPKEDKPQQEKPKAKSVLDLL